MEKEGSGSTGGRVTASKSKSIAIQKLVIPEVVLLMSDDDDFVVKVRRIAGCIILTSQLKASSSKKLVMDRYYS
jgi:phosphohistidine swiveling domain-containing protein